ncbi:Hint domain-containing protein [Ruixingdingia sedimenti]|uniref:Hint domain-containing protein n=1 Tax=Ruixingdingia sedimenti TaxID=3073604 RepID=A0ABU1F4P9_9RHOB|nr:Hint domain-containing protein [Xinfangfangia sp. LG-4]MDR5651851.1 Hint domain-containing protein [Xinfangfangia sp. LG-4]
MTQEADGAAQRLSVYPAGDIYVVSGANLGDGLGAPAELSLGDIYELDPDAQPRLLALAQPRGDAAAAGRQQLVAPGSEVGAPGDPVMLTARLVMMAPDGDRVELLVLHHRAAGRSSAAGIHVLPLSAIAPRTEYTLLSAEDSPADVRLADLLCLSFCRGTRIALASGAQVPIEQLQPGDRVLTRDHGPQPLRWIGRTTLRARGGFAPVVIAAGTMGNDADLIVGQHHRLFLYQRDRRAGVATAELLVQARHLVDGSRIYLREGGFAEYFSLVFERHEIIYAEGIPVESLMINDTTIARLPDGLAEELRARFPGLSQSQHFGTELPEPPAR